MNSKEKLHPNQLLKKVADEERGWIPEECKVSFYKLVVTPFIELVIIRRTKQGREYFLTYRKDEYFTGWHVPGGMVKPNHPENLAGMCKALIDRELPGGRIVGDIRIMKALKWAEHPWGNPLAIVCLCEIENIKETEKEKFFPANQLPAPMASQYHIEYIQECEQFLAS